MKKLPILSLSLLLALVLAGCATKGMVRKEVAAVNDHVAQIEDQVEASQTRLDQHQEAIVDAAKSAEGASKTAQDALDRAIEAGKLAKGKIVFETVLSNDKVRFAFDKVDFGEDAAAVLDAFAETIKAYDSPVYVEIQGHTDSVGSEAYNQALGEERAEAVRRYLNGTHGLPLHRMSVISYGESAPLADNGQRDGRAKNRRVNLVVLQ